MNQCNLRPVYPLLMLALLANLQLAMAQQPQGMQINTAQPRLYQQLTETRAPELTRVGLARTLKTESQHFLLMDITAKVHWDQHHRHFRYRDRDLTVRDADGKTYRPIGLITDGALNNRVQLDFSRPANWHDQPARSFSTTLVYLLPATTASITFHGPGADNQSITLPAVLRKPPLITPRIQLITAVWMDAIQFKTDQDKQQVQTTLTPAQGRVVCLKLKVLPPPETTGRRWNWQIGQLGLQLKLAGRPVQVGCAGTVYGQQWLGRMMATAFRNSEQDPWQAEPVTVYFVVPQGSDQLHLSWAFASILPVLPGVWRTGIEQQPQPTGKPSVGGP